ncbi:MAG: putative S-layer protein [Candidatus Nanoarchaeia archaeon]|nr:putative S-layer protein [Candidatus Nanoarchaeia archaeon]
MKKLAIMFLAVLLTLAGAAYAAVPTITTATDKIDSCGTDCFVFYENVQGKLTVTATDTAGETVTLSLDATTPLSGLSEATLLPVIATGVNPVNSVLTWEPSDTYDFSGVKLLFKAVDNAAIPNTITKELTIRVYPDFCERGNDDVKTDQFDFGSLDFDNDDYNIFDQVDVTVNNVKANEDITDVEVELCLFNIDTGTKVDCWTSETTQDLDSGEDEDYDVSFKIPNDEEIGSSDKYWLFAIATGDSDESSTEGDLRCSYKSDTIKIEREKYNVIITDAYVTPTMVEAGDTFDVSVTVENVGTKDSDGVYVKIKDLELKIDEKSSTYDLSKYDDSDNDATAKFTLTVPEDAKTKQYNVEAIVYFDDGKETNSQFLTLDVTGPSKAVEAQESTTVDSVLLSIQEAVAEGNAFSLPVTVTNKGTSQVLSVELTNLDDWAKTGSAKSQLLDRDQSTTFYFYITPNEGVTGTRTATANVLSEAGKVVKTQSISLKLGGEVVEEPETSASEGIKNFFSENSKVLWIIGDIILVVLAVFLLKALFIKKKK